MAEAAESSADEGTASPSESVSPVPNPSNSSLPPTAKMVMEAIKELGERGGSSLVAIKKYIGTTYNVDPEKRAAIMKRYLKDAVVSGALVQTKGTGANGSFKLPSAKVQAAKLKEAKKLDEAAAAAKTAPTKKASKKSGEAAQEKSPTRKPASSKVSKKDSSEPMKAAKTAKMAPQKSPKAKKTARSPTKPKAPRAKKVTTSAKSPKAAAPKKATAAKK